MAESANAVDSTADVLSESYGYDAWGNMTQSGSFGFQQSYTASNQVNGFAYDAAGELTGDTINSYTYNAEGLLTGTGGGAAQYIYDALDQRVEKLSGSNVGEVIYFNGHPIARLTATSSGSALNWTSDLLWAGDSLLAELGQTPTYRLLDHEGSLAVATDASGNVLGTNVLTPYGQAMNEGLGDAYTWAGLFQDTEYSGHAAWYRDYSARAARWLTPDPYNGSYNTYRPQSFNRYMYVMGNPLGSVDPSGLADGIINGVGGSPCKAFNGTLPIGTSNVTFNPCDPVASGIALVAVAVYSYYIADTTGASFTSAFNGVSSGSAADVSAVVAAALTIACSIHYDAAACGPKGWASDVIGGDAGKVVGDTFAVAGAVACLVIGPSACVGYAIYTIANDVFAAVWSALGLGPPQFTGSLLPRPTDLGGLGTSPIGIPNQNLTVQGILGLRSDSPVPSPTVIFH